MLGKAKRCNARHCKGEAKMIGPQTKISKDFFRVSRHVPVSCGKCAVQLTLLFLIKNVSNPQKIPGRPDMDIDFFCCSGIGMSKAGGNKLDGDTFCVKRCCEIMPQSLRTKSRYPGVPGKFFTQII